MLLYGAKSDRIISYSTVYGEYLYHHFVLTLILYSAFTITMITLSQHWYSTVYRQCFHHYNITTLILYSVWEMPSPSLYDYPRKLKLILTAIYLHFWHFFLFTSIFTENTTEYFIVKYAYSDPLQPIIYPAHHTEPLSYLYLLKMTTCLMWPETIQVTNFIVR